ncbi:DivIVA domain-containing protein [Nocardiopsis trehalosi]|uniref:DivIVA domain-containing protein n=1 Tax=Nocardiopsis trehalosi TaxID=109329 RepID=UPI0008336C4A|nr:DivIVA domain-containing protein [Nocardiopsis trehalosi]
MTAREDTGAARRSQPRLSPERVRTQEFSRASLGRRGYDEQEVRFFIGRLAEDIAAGDAERMSLRSEIERLRTRFREQQSTAADPAPHPSGPPADAVNLLSAAQQQADAYVAQAQEYCRQLTEQARRQSDEILQEARVQAEAAAEAAVAEYRATAGPRHSADLEEVERRVAWLQSFSRAVQIQMQAASDAFAREISRLSDLSAGAAETYRGEPEGARRAEPADPGPLSPPPPPQHGARPVGHRPGDRV